MWREQYQHSWKVRKNSVILPLYIKPFTLFFPSAPIIIPSGTECTEGIRTELLIWISNRSASINAPLKWATQETLNIVWLPHITKSLAAEYPHPVTPQPFNRPEPAPESTYLLVMTLLCQQQTAAF